MLIFPIFNKISYIIFQKQNKYFKYINKHINKNKLQKLNRIGLIKNFALIFMKKRLNIIQRDVVIQSFCNTIIYHIIIADLNNYIHGFY